MTVQQSQRGAAGWRIAPGTELSLAGPRIIGIVNATPDSFSDGGMFKSVDALIGHALRLVEEGAEIIDIGGESTRPGAMRISGALQIERVVPFIEQFRECSEVPISIDTTQSEVAEAALEAGATIINDVSAGREDGSMFGLASARGCGLILMHRRVPPEEDSFSDDYIDEPVYEDVVGEVREFLVDRAEAARAAGVEREAIVIDPGLGFGKSLGQNYEIIRRTGELVSTGYPVLSGASRKSFIGKVTGVERPRARVIGSSAVSVAQYLAGVRVFRVHDVAAHRQALDVTCAIAGASNLPQPAGECLG